MSTVPDLSITVGVGVGAASMPARSGEPSMPRMNPYTVREQDKRQSASRAFAAIALILFYPLQLPSSRDSECVMFRK